MAINPSSLLGRSQTTNPQPQTSPVSSIIPNRNVPNVTPPEREDSPEGGKTILDQLVQIKDKVLSIQKIITKNEKLFQKMEENNRKQEENERRKNKELKLEEKKEDLPIKDLENKEFPKIGLLDKIKRFIFYTLVGSAFVKFGKHLPKIIQFTKYLIPAFDFFEKFTVNLLNGVTDFIGAGYKAYDKVKELTANLVGDKTEEQLKEFDTQFNKFANLALIVGMSTLGGTDFGIGGGKKERLGVDKKTGQRVSKRSQARFLDRYGEKAYIERFGKRSFKGLTGKTAGRFASKAFGKIPIIGGLVDFIISTVIFKEKPGRAAAKAVGATIGSALGTLIPFPLAGTLLGGYLGDLVGGTLYDSIVGGEPPKAKARGGQVTRGNRKVGGSIKRTIRKPRKRPVKTLPQKTIPGKDVGGKKQIEKIFSPAAIKVLETTSDNVKKVPLLNGIMGASVDLAMGQKPDRKTYKQIGDGFGYLIQNAMDAEVASSMSDIRSQLIGLAGGGVVPRTLRSDENIGMKIGERLAKTFEIMVNSEVSNTLQAIRRQLGTDTSGGAGGVEGETPGVGGEFTEANIGSNEMDLFQRMVYAEAGGEGKVGMALVARAILNRAGLIQSGKVSPGTFNSLSGSITDVITAPKQFSPMTDGRINQKLSESQLNQALDAIKLAQNPSRLAEILKNEGLDDNTIAKLSAVTGFRNYSAGAGYDPSQAVNETNYKRHTFNTAGNKTLLVPKGVAIKLGVTAPESMVSGGLKPSDIPMTSQQGWRWGKMHKGIDLDGGDGSPISSAQDAKVVWAGDKGDGYGYSVILKYSNGAETRFAHLKSINVRTGQSIKAGQLIGKQGNTGASKGSHLHFEYYPKGGALSYEGYGDAASVKDNYFRYGGDVKAKPLQTPADKANVDVKDSTPPSKVRTKMTRKSWNPERDSGLKRNEKGEWVKASLAPSESKALASGIDTEASYEKTGGINVTTVARQAMIIREEVQTASSGFSPTLNNYGTTNKNLSSVIG